MTLPPIVAKKKEKLSYTEGAGRCAECGAKCCRYVALEIDRPTGRKDYDHIRWYLLHRRVHVFVDHADDWYIEFESDCEQLGPDLRCLNYDHRPRICRRYGDDDLDCEHLSEDKPYKKRFSTADAFEAWLEKKRKKYK